jgi:hypothetical protein
MPHEVGAKAAAIARQAGFHAAFTTEPAVLNAKSLTNRFRMPRIMLTKKAQHLSIVSAYMSGVPSMIKRTAGMSKFGVGNG